MSHNEAPQVGKGRELLSFGFSRLVGAWRLSVVLVIAALSSLICLYLILRVGLAFGGSLFGVFLYMLFGMDNNVHRANLAQTAGSGAAFSAWTLAMVAAMMIADQQVPVEERGFQLEVWQALILLPVVCFQGMLYALPFRRVLVHKLGLPWPTAEACVELLKKVGSFVSWQMFLKVWMHLLAAIGGSFAGTYYSGLNPSWWPNVLAKGSPYAGYLTAPFAYGVGFLVRYHVGVTLLLGALFFNHVELPESFIGEEDWKTWAAIALMTAAGFSAPLFQMLLKRRVSVKAEAETKEEVAFWGTELFGVRSEKKGYAIYGGILIGNVALLAFLFSWIFGLHPVVTILSVIAAWPLVIVAAYCVGATDINPISTLVKVVIVVAVLVGLRCGPLGLLALALIGASATVAADWFSDTKVGDTIGTPFRVRFKYELLGVMVGIVVATPVLYFLVDSEGIGKGTLLPAPGPQVWAEIAVEVSQGINFSQELWLVIAAAAVIGVVWAYFQEVLQRRKFPFIPSAVVFGIALFLGKDPEQRLFMCWAICAGSLLRLVTEKGAARWDEKYGSLVAAGVLVGDIAATLLVLWVMMQRGWI